MLISKTILTALWLLSFLCFAVIESPPALAQLDETSDYVEPTDDNDEDSSYKPPLRQPSEEVWQAGEPWGTEGYQNPTPVIEVDGENEMSNNAAGLPPPGRTVVTPGGKSMKEW